MKKIKVLQIQNSYNRNVSDLGLQVLKGLPEDEFDITSVFLRGKLSEDEESSIPGRVVTFEFSAAQCKGFRRQLNKILLDFCHKEQFDTVIAHRFKPINILMKLAKKLSIKHCIGVVHGIGDFDRFYRRFETKRGLDERWRVVGVSASVCSYLCGLKAGFNRGNTLTINNAIDIDSALTGQLSRSEARDRLGISEGSFVFGTIGRLVPVKGHKYFVAAFILLASKYPDAELVIVGGGRLEEQLRDQAKVAGLSDRIHFPGMVSDAGNYAKAFDAFVLPSLSEGLPLSILEAMAASLPVIGSDIPQIRSIIDGVGLLAKVENENSLASSMGRLLDMSKDNLTALGQSSFYHISKNHDINDYRKSYRALIEGDGCYRRV